MPSFSGALKDKATPAQPKSLWLRRIPIICLTLFTGLCITAPSNGGRTLLGVDLPSVNIRLSPPPAVAAQPKGRFGQLSASALAEYHDIQAALVAADWEKFDRLIAAARDQRLAASFNALKLMHPAYQPSGATIAGWLKDNKTHPMAPAVLVRAQSVMSPIERRQVPALTAVAALSGGDAEADGRSSTKNAPEAILSAAMKFFGGNDDGAREDMKDNEAPLALWTSGLAAWRQNDIGAARDAFTRLAANDDLHDWDRASAAFWSGRAAARQGDKADAAIAWRKAMNLAPRSFYGLLAAQNLGVTPEFAWQVPTPVPSDLKEISSLPNGERALMWLELGDNRLAEAELRQTVGRATASQRRAMLLLAESEKMPNLAYGLALYARGKYAELRLPALYPVPSWEPQGGFATSPALVFALMRQESAFNPNARSAAGAQGAMQMMPDTAARLVRSADERRTLKASLSQPETAIKLGERYLQLLAGQGMVRGNLLKMIAAYNCGTGNLQRWTNELPLGDDPLLFVESLPARETRDFVETVMANYWMYQLRLQQEPTSLKTLAKGSWPKFEANNTVEQLASAR